MADEMTEFEQMVNSLGGADDEVVESTDAEDTGKADPTDEEVTDVEELESDTPMDGETSEEEGQPDRVAALERQIAELKELLSGKAPEKESKAAEPEPVQLPVAELSEIDFFSSVDIDDVMQDQETFKSWFIESIDKVRKADRDVIMQTVYQSIPNIIQKHVVEQVEGKAHAENFYNANKDLTEHKPTVAKMALFVKENFPDLAMEDFYDKVADMTRHALNLTAKVKSTVGEKPGKKTTPAFVNKSVRAKSKSPAEELSATEQEIQNLISIM